MARVIACKLPHGLTIVYGTERLNINGANADYDAANPGPNSAITESANVIAGYGITKLTDAQASTFDAWKQSVTTGPDGKPLVELFLPLTNGSLEEFSSEADARKSLPALTGMVSTGAEGLDADAEMKRAVGNNPGLEVETGVASGKK